MNGYNYALVKDQVNDKKYQIDETLLFSLLISLYAFVDLQKSCKGLSRQKIEQKKEVLYIILVIGLIFTIFTFQIDMNADTTVLIELIMVIAGIITSSKIS